MGLITHFQAGSILFAANLNSAFAGTVNVAGDTMTGPLIITGPGTTLTVVGTAVIPSLTLNAVDVGTGLIQAKANANSALNLATSAFAKANTIPGISSQTILTANGLTVNTGTVLTVVGNNIVVLSINSASTTGVGTVQLNDTVTSGSTTQASTANVANVIANLATTMIQSSGDTITGTLFANASGIGLAVANNMTVNGSLTVVGIDIGTGLIQAKINANSSLNLVTGAYANANSALNLSQSAFDKANTGGGVITQTILTANGITVNNNTSITFSGNNILVISANIANTTTLGTTKLIDLVSSGDTGNAATANAVNSVWATAQAAFVKANTAGGGGSAITNQTILTANAITVNNTTSLTVSGNSVVILSANVGNTTQAGFVQLNDTVVSTSTTLAATANAINTAWSTAKAAFTRANSGIASVYVSSLAVTPLANQQVNTAFSITGTWSFGPILNYADDSGSFTTLPVPNVAPMLTSDWNFTHPAMNAGAHLINVKDTSSNASVTVPVNITSTSESANLTIVLAGSQNTIIDANGKVFAITGVDNHITIDGSSAIFSVNVVELVYIYQGVAHLVWQQNNAGLWWFFDTPSLSWQPPAGTNISPLPSGANNAVYISGRFQNPPQAFTDSAGVSWKISLMAQIMFKTPTGAWTIDTFTGQAVAATYIGGVIWHQNAAGNWYNKVPTATPVAGGWTNATGSPLASGQAKRVNDFWATTGVNVHSNLPGTPSADPSIVKPAVDYLGVAAVRDRWGPVNAGTTALVNAGYKFSVLVDGQAGGAESTDTPAMIAPNIGTWITNYGANSIAMLESVNEPNKDSLGITLTQNLAQGLGSAVLARADCKDIIPTASFSSWFLSNFQTNVIDFANGVGDQTSRGINYANFHGFTGTSGIGTQPWDEVQEGPQGAITYARNILCPGRPFAVTEFGYNPGAGSFKATPAAQGIMSLNYFLDVFYLGGAYSFLYQLFDETSEGFQLFDNLGTPSTAASIIHNFMTIIKDTAVDARIFNPGVLNYTVLNMPTTGASAGRYMLFQKSSGVYVLILWNEPAIQNSVPQDIAAPVSNITVQFNEAATLASVTRYDPAINTLVQQNYGSIAANGSVPVSLIGRPQILFIQK